jgi:hypothetical protein
MPSLQFILKGMKLSMIKALVMESLPFPDIDGLMGWPALLGYIWRVKWKNMSLSLMSSIPKQILSWQSLKLDTQIPMAAAMLFENSGGLLYLETGHLGGIALSESHWNKWVQENSHMPRTLKSGCLLAVGGIFSAELTWVNSFELGFLEISCVIIPMASAGSEGSDRNTI